MRRSRFYTKITRIYTIHTYMTMSKTTNRCSFRGLELSAWCLIVVYRHNSWGGRKTCQKRRTLSTHTHTHTHTHIVASQHTDTVHVITFHVSLRPREMYCGHARLCVYVSVCRGVARNSFWVGIICHCTILQSYIPAAWRHRLQLVHKIIFRDWFWEGIYTDIPPVATPLSVCVSVCPRPYAHATARTRM